MGGPGSGRKKTKLYRGMEPSASIHYKGKKVYSNWYTDELGRRKFVSGKGVRIK